MEKYFIFAPDFLPKKGTLGERSQWLKENCRGEWYYDPLQEGYFFYDKDEAFLFKMRWEEDRDDHKY